MEDKTQPIVWVVLYGSRSDETDSIWSSENLAEKRMAQMRRNIIKERGSEGVNYFKAERYTLDKDGDFEEWI